MARVRKPEGTEGGSERALELLGREAPEAVALLSRIVRDEGQKPELRMKAAESILDRVCGKPTAAASVGAAVRGDISVRFEGELEEWSR